MTTEVFILIASTIILFFWLMGLRNKSAALRQPQPIVSSAFSRDSGHNNSG